MPVKNVLVVPGLFEQPWMTWLLRRFLARDGFNVTLFRDRLAFRNVDDSIARARETIASYNGNLHVVTHSFGDWVVRQALAELPDDAIQTLVSITPVMRSSWIPKMVQAATGDWIPELAIIADKQRAATEANIQVRRLIVWARFDLWVRPLPSGIDIDVVQVQTTATHLSVVWQPNVLRRICEFLEHPPAQREGRTR